MKEYKNNEELIDYLISKNVIINDRELALKNIEKYSYYSIINGYKAVFKDENSNYKENTSFEEISNRTRITLINFAKYHLIMFAMAKIMEMNNTEQNQIVMYLYNNI